MKTEQRLQALLTHYGRLYPDIWHKIEQARLNFMKRDPELARWSFLPMGHVAELGIRPHKVMDLAALHFLGAWRLSQGIYRIPASHFQQVWDAPLEGDIPAQALQHLPEWAVYIETPGVHLNTTPNEGVECHGVFVMQELFSLDDTRQLTLLFHTSWDEEPLVLEALPLIGSVEDAVQALLDQMIKYQIPHAGMERGGQWNERYLRINRGMVNLILWVCSKNREAAGILPSPVQPRKVKGGLRYFPPAKPTVYELGTVVQALSASPGRWTPYQSPTGMRVEWVADAIRKIIE